jgi:sialic acid synthase SpsE
VARLDLLRRGRRTLVAARPIVAGAVLGEADLAELVGGTGIGADYRAEVIGRRAMYAMAEGTAVDFGMISEDPVAGVPEAPDGGNAP